MSVLNGLVGAAIGAGSGIIGTYANANQARINREFNKSMAQYQNAENLKQWNRQNAYNDPSAQMARLKAAGLNPNLVYGTPGAANAGNSTSSPQMAGASASGSSNIVQPFDSGAALAAAQIANLNAEARVKNAQADKTSGVDTDYTAAAAELNKANAALSQSNTSLNEAMHQITSDPNYINAMRNKPLVENVMGLSSSKLNDANTARAWTLWSYDALNQAMALRLGESTLKLNDAQIAKLYAEVGLSKAQIANLRQSARNFSASADYQEAFNHMLNRSSGQTNDAGRVLTNMEYGFQSEKWRNPQQGFGLEKRGQNRQILTSLANGLLIAGSLIFTKKPIKPFF